MQKISSSLPLLALALLLQCSEEEGSSTATGSGGASATGGSDTGGSGGSDTTGGSAGNGGQSGTGGSGASSGAGGSNSGDGGQGADAGASGEGGGGSDGDCSQCMLENCSDEWAACEADAECNACGQCLDGENTDFLSCLTDGSCGNVAQEPVTAAMIDCGCAPGGPCDEICCLGM
jgi:hypothetical protein